MLSHDECLSLIRKKNPGRAVISSCRSGNNYYFSLSYDNKITDENYTWHHENFRVNAETGDAEPFDIFGYRLLELTTPEDLKKFDDDCKLSFRFIDAEPKTIDELVRM